MKLINYLESVGIVADDDVTGVQLGRTASAAVDNLEAQMLQKYKFSLRDILENPSEYSEKPNIQSTIDLMKKDIDDYFNTVKAEYAEEEKKLSAELKRIDDIYKKIDADISSKASELNVPYIDPLEINRDPTADETIVLYDYGDSVEKLIEKLLSSSIYVADISTPYADYMIGFWFFSGPRPRALCVNAPTSPLLDIEAGRLEIESILERVTALS